MLLLVTLVENKAFVILCFMSMKCFVSFFFTFSNVFFLLCKLLLLLTFSKRIFSKVIKE